jgi:hypothetical protein
MHTYMLLSGVTSLGYCMANWCVLFVYKYIHTCIRAYIYIYIYIYAYLCVYVRVLQAGAQVRHRGVLSF